MLSWLKHGEIRSLGKTQMCFRPKTREHWWMSCWVPQDYSGQVYSWQSCVSCRLPSEKRQIWRGHVRDVTGTRIVKVENERLLEKGEAFRGTTWAKGTEGGREQGQSQVKLFSVFWGGMRLFCRLLQAEGYLSPPAVPPSCHTLLCSSLSWHPGTRLPLPVCVLHICWSSVQDY